ncbi:thiolase family protein [Thermodesulfobacteriota bacterium]
MSEVVIVSAARSAIGGFGGSIKNITPFELGKLIISEVLSRGNVKPDWIGKVIFGCNMLPLEQNIARNCAYLAGIPEEVPGFTINSTCGASIQAIISAVQAIRDGEAQAIIAGGLESMSNAPYILTRGRWGQRLRHMEALDLLWAGMQEPPIGVGMGLTAENLAEKYGISREEQDAFALLSHQRAIKAIQESRFKAEIMPIPVPRRKGDPLIFDTDEHPRDDLTMDKLAALPPAFKEGGTVTAGNACGLNDGVAAAVLMSRERADELGIKPLAKIRGYNVIGVDPNYMGIGPVPSIRAVLKKAGLAQNDIERFEINEAFAAQYLSCERELSLDREKVNIYGNGIALGHPVGATGARLLATLLYGMINDDLNLGVFSLCAGGGMGFAVILERI